LAAQRQPEEQKRYLACLVHYQYFFYFSAMKLFRSIRFKMIQGQNISRYLAYALGEIVLVVLGILIALYINTLSGQQKREKRLDTIFGIVKSDLITDTINSTQFIEAYEQMGEGLEKSLNGFYTQAYYDTINESNYYRCSPCFSQIARFIPFYSQSKGYNLLNRVDFSTDKQSDSTAQQILHFYSYMERLNTDLLAYIAELSFENLQYLEQYPWYIDHSMLVYNPEYIAFFRNDPLYRNKIATFQTLVINNYLNFIKGHKQQATLLIEQIEAMEARSEE